MSRADACVGFPFEGAIGIEAEDGATVGVVTGIGEIYLFCIGVHGHAIKTCNGSAVGNESGRRYFAGIQVDGMVGVGIGVGGVAPFRRVGVGRVTHDAEVAGSDVERVDNMVALGVDDIKVGRYVEIVAL